MASCNKMIRCPGTLHEDRCGFQVSSVHEDEQKDWVMDKNLGRAAPHWVRVVPAPLQTLPQYPSQEPRELQVGRTLLTSLRLLSLGISYSLLGVRARSLLPTPHCLILIQCWKINWSIWKFLPFIWDASIPNGSTRPKVVTTIPQEKLGRCFTEMRKHHRWFDWWWLTQVPYLGQPCWLCMISCPFFLESVHGSSLSCCCLHVIITISDPPCLVALPDYCKSHGSQALCCTSLAFVARKQLCFTFPSSQEKALCSFPNWFPWTWKMAPHLTITTGRLKHQRLACLF